MTELREEGGSTLESLLTLIASHTISRLDKTATCNIKWWLWTNVRTIAWVFRTWFCSLLLWNSWDLHSSLCPFETGNSLNCIQAEDPSGWCLSLISVAWSNWECLYSPLDEDISDLFALHTTSACTGEEKAHQPYNSWLWDICSDLNMNNTNLTLTFVNCY